MPSQNVDNKKRVTKLVAAAFAKPSIKIPKGEYGSTVNTDNHGRMQILPQSSEKKVYSVEGGRRLRSRRTQKRKQKRNRSLRKKRSLRRKRGRRSRRM